MKYTNVLFLCTILITLIFPLFVFYIQDNMDLHTSKYKNTEYFHQIRDTYPIISHIYSNTYEQKESYSTNSYDISHPTSYDEETQEEIRKAKQAYEAQIQELIQRQVLPSSVFPLEKDSYTISYGTLQNIEETSSTSSLDQVHIFQPNNTYSQYFSYLKPADKITYIFLTNERIQAISEAECKEIAWHMIEYLGLADIQDWNYVNDRYESYQAKLQVYCQTLENVDDHANMRIGVIPISLDVNPAIG